MEAKATLRYIRISPRKVGILCDLIRGKSVAQANAILALTPKAAAEPLAKLVKSAAANAENKYGVRPENLVVKAAYVDEGPTMKRYRLRAKGSASPIMKRTSHITIIVATREEA